KMVTGGKTAGTTRKQKTLHEKERRRTLTQMPKKLDSHLQTTLLTQQQRLLMSHVQLPTLHLGGLPILVPQIISVVTQASLNPSSDSESVTGLVLWYLTAVQ